MSSFEEEVGTDMEEGFKQPYNIVTIKSEDGDLSLFKDGTEHCIYLYPDQLSRLKQLLRVIDKQRVREAVEEIRREVCNCDKELGQSCRDEYILELVLKRLSLGEVKEE